MSHRHLLQAASICLATMAHAHASPLYGITSTVTVSSGNFLSTFPAQRADYNNGGNPYQVTSYTSPVLSASGSYTFGSDAISGIGYVWDSANGDSLHGYGSISISGICQTCGAATEDLAIFDIDLYDTISVGGLPNGTPADLLLTSALDSSILLNGGNSDIYVDFSIAGSGDNYATNTSGAANGFLSNSVVLHTFAGATLSSVLTLYGNAVVIEDTPPGTESSSIVMDASDTGSGYITVLTPGATYSSASGIVYAAPSDVPEPTTMVPMAAGTFYLWLRLRVRRRQRKHLR